MKKVLLQLDTDEHPSPFDAIVAHDAGVDVLLSHGNVKRRVTCAALVQDAFFTRGIDDLKTMAVWVGGKRVAAGEEIFDEVQKAFFGPFRVSVMLDSNGCNTTAATTIARIAKARDLAGDRAVVIGLGRRRAALGRAAAEGGLRGRRWPRSRPTCSTTIARTAARAASTPPRSSASTCASRPTAASSRRCSTERRSSCPPGPSGVQVLRKDFWARHPTHRAARRLQRGRPARPRGHEGDRRPRRLRRQARARRAGDRRPEDEGAQDLRAADVREQRPGARHRRRLRDRQGARL